MKVEEKLQVYVIAQGKTYRIADWPECASRCWTLSTGGETTASPSFIWRRFIENSEQITYSIAVEENGHAIEPPELDTYEEWLDWLNNQGKIKGARHV